MGKLQEELQQLADSLNIPNIITWKQGEFINSPKYDHMGEQWKFEQEEREQTLIRPGGGTNNALFQVSGYPDPSVITEYLEAVGKLLAEYKEDN